MKAKRFQDLEVWRKAHEFVLNVYQVTKKFPQEERYGLALQMRRAAISVPANIAEGFTKRTLKDKSHYYNVAQGSLEEMRYYIILSKDLGYIRDAPELEENGEAISKMLYGLIKSIQKTVARSQ
ncbi:four helix bundle protein [candidate division TA06 bacterium]|nr:four helix bundle protein [candidate division TA06 bacterium]